MAFELITLPLRVGVRAANFVLRGAGEAAGRAFVVAESVVRVVRPSGSEGSNGDAPPPPRTEPQPEPEAAAPPAPEAAAPPAPKSDAPAPAVATEPAIDYDAPVPEEPAHVSEEPELVAELAEPGAEDGAGAAVRVEEPWEGYRQLTAQEVIARVGDASPEELATVQLYEGLNRKRESVMSAVERQLRRAVNERSRQ